jgi:hypothetical protein
MWRSLAAHLLWDQMLANAVLKTIDRGQELATMSAVLEVRCNGIRAQGITTISGSDCIFVIPPLPPRAGPVCRDSNRSAITLAANWTN